MSQFRVAGHTLIREGARHHRDGEPVTIYDSEWHDPSGHGKCSCGAISPKSLPTKAARKRWHVGHKLDIVHAEGKS